MAINQKHKTTFELDADTRKLDTKLKKTGDNLDNVGEKGFSAFKTKMVVGIAAAGAALGVFIKGIGASIVAASELEESVSKFGTVFKEVGDEAEQMRKRLQTDFGLSEQAATDLLGATGDLLAGFGFTGEQALDLSSQVQELAVDLASFTNAQGGAEAVSNALTKALLGERESLKTFGISIAEADIKARLLERGLGDLTGEALRQAKAYVTLELATKQSGNAIGDYARTSEGFANTQRRVDAGIENLTANLGKRFLPAATDAAHAVEGLVDTLNDYVEVPVSEQIQQEQVDLFVLTSRIASYNVGSEERNKLLGQLKAQYPDLLADLDTEKTTNEELAKILKEVNTGYRERIANAIKEEKITELLTEAKNKEREIEKDRALIARIYLDVMGEGAKEFLSTQEQIDALIEKRAAGDVSFFGADVKKIISATQTLGEINQLTREQTGIIDEITRRQADLVTSTEEVTTATEKDTDATLKNTQAKQDSAFWESARIEVLKEVQLAVFENSEMEDRIHERFMERMKEQQEAIAVNLKERSDASEDALKEAEGHARHMVRIGDAIGNALVAGFDAEGLKGALKNVLITVLGFIEREVLAAQVAALVRSSFGDFTAIAQVVAISAAFEALKLSISSFATGTENFPGGLAKVHKDETLLLPTGTSVYNRRETANNFEDNTALITNTNKLLGELVSLTKNKTLKIKRGDIYESVKRAELDNMKKTK